MRLVWTSCLWLLIASGAIAQPIVSDSRIKTLVYNPNEVFTITTHYGYQANIEFGANEEIKTISLGDRVGWLVTPGGRRLFIRAMEENSHTNMTVVTSQRAYQFDLRSSASNAVYGSEELVYVVRFFYPEESGGAPLPNAAIGARPVQVSAPSLVLSAPVSPVAAAPLTAPSPPPAGLPAPELLDQPTAPIQAKAVLAPQMAPSATGLPSAMNYRYTYTGPSEIAPVKIFDDGAATYFKFRPGAPLPRVAVITAAGEEVSVPYQVNTEGLVVVKVVAPRFALRENGYEVVVYNEAQITG